MVNALKYSKKFKAHDEQNEAKIGDIVRIMETRPLSATKRFRLVEVSRKSSYYLIVRIKYHSEGRLHT